MQVGPSAYDGIEVLAIAIDPDEARELPTRAHLVRENAVVRGGKDGGSCRTEVLHLLGYRSGLSRQPESCRIEVLCHQNSIFKKEQVASGRGGG
jgi:hypothetical protein